MPIPTVTSQALVAAMARFDSELRNSAEWSGWEENKAHVYAIEHEAKLYPIKQVVSIATGLPVSEFSGGKASGDANAFVESRGLKVVELRGRNPPWTRDELILALNFYLQHAGNPPAKESAEIAELSDTLGSLARYLGISKASRFRNANGVYMKLMNFRRFDPKFAAAGKVGLSRGGKIEREIWDEFAKNPTKCRKVAATIRAVALNASHGETVECCRAKDGWTTALRSIAGIRRRLGERVKSTQNGSSRFSASDPLPTRSRLAALR